MSTASRRQDQAIVSKRAALSGLGLRNAAYAGDREGAA
jgi:hypothetical protein